MPLITKLVVFDANLVHYMSKCAGKGGYKYPRLGWAPEGGYKEG